MKLLLVLMATLVTGNVVAQKAKTNFILQDYQTFADTIKNPNVQLIDVRTPAEFQAGHIPNAVNMDVNSQDFTKRIEELDPKKPVAVYCRSGVRSKRAADELLEKGYVVYDLDGGILSWKGKLAK